MKELNGFTPFNHGYLCQMLRSASDNELANILNDVNKEQERRKDAKKNEYLNNIRKAISDAIKAGYNIDFFPDSDSEESYFSIHSNNEFLYNIELYTDD
jgi:hypothetical protein